MSDFFLELHRHAVKGGIIESDDNYYSNKKAELELLTSISRQTSKLLFSARDFYTKKIDYKHGANACTNPGEDFSNLCNNERDAKWRKHRVGFGHEITVSLSRYADMGLDYYRKTLEIEQRSKEPIDDETADADTDDREMLLGRISDGFDALTKITSLVYDSSNKKYMKAADEYHESVGTLEAYESVENAVTGLQENLCNAQIKAGGEQQCANALSEVYKQGLAQAGDACSVESIRNGTEACRAAMGALTKIAHNELGKDAVESDKKIRTLILAEDKKRAEGAYSSTAIIFNKQINKMADSICNTARIQDSVKEKDCISSFEKNIHDRLNFIAETTSEKCQDLEGAKKNLCTFGLKANALADSRHRIGMIKYSLDETYIEGTCQKFQENDGALDSCLTETRAAVKDPTISNGNRYVLTAYHHALSSCAEEAGNLKQANLKACTNNLMSAYDEHLRKKASISCNAFKGGGDEGCVELATNTFTNRVHERDFNKIMGVSKDVSTGKKSLLQLAGGYIKDLGLKTLEKKYGYMVDIARGGGALCSFFLKPS